jgi:hypothetical protein
MIVTSTRAVGLDRAGFSLGLGGVPGTDLSSFTSIRRIAVEPLLNLSRRAESLVSISPHSYERAQVARMLCTMAVRIHHTHNYHLETQDRNR